MMAPFLNLIKSTIFRLSLVYAILLFLTIYLIVKNWPISKAKAMLFGIAGISAILILLSFTITKRQHLGKIIWHGSVRTNYIALTFDDGPDIKYTPQILDILKENKVKATFFLVGRKVEKYPEIAKRIVEEGHIVGNHTYSHTNLLLDRKKTVKKEIKRCEDAIVKNCGVVPYLFRPPYGFRTPLVYEVAEEKGYLVVLWSLSSHDWVSPGKERIINRVLKKSKNGAIILFHDSGGNRQQTVDALPEIIKQLKNKGYNLVGIPEILNSLYLSWF